MKLPLAQARMLEHIGATRGRQNAVQSVDDKMIVGEAIKSWKEKKKLSNITPSDCKEWADGTGCEVTRMRFA